MRRKAITLDKGEYLIPPCEGVAVVEYADRIQLSPTYWCREFVGMGRFDQSELFPWLKKKRKWWWPWGAREDLKPAAAPDKDGIHPVFLEALGKKPWVIIWWEVFDDGRANVLETNLTDSNTSKEKATEAFEHMVNSMNMTKAELEELGTLFHQKPEDIAYVKNRFPEGAPDPKNIEEYDLYQARLKVLAGMQPKTVSFMELANQTTKQHEREGYHHEAVSAYFAELARSWNEDQFRAWQQSNPLGSPQWMREYGRVLDNPTKKLDPINHALVLDWLRKGLNLLTAEEIASVVFKTTGYRVNAASIKKRRERLGLVTKRPTGPRPNFEL